MSSVAPSRWSTSIPSFVPLVQRNHVLVALQVFANSLRLVVPRISGHSHSGWRHGLDTRKGNSWRGFLLVLQLHLLMLFARSPRATFRSFSAHLCVRGLVGWLETNTSKRKNELS